MQKPFVFLVFTSMQREAIMQHLGHFIVLLKVPGRADCEECIASNSSLKGLTNWRKVKDLIYAKIQKAKRHIKK
jgi:hypothetical protein